MTRLLSEHAGILYPSDPHELDRLVVPVAMEEDLPSPGALNGLPAALIVPHASYGYCLPQLRQAFSSTLGLDPELIVALAPLHRPCLLEDTASGASIFCPESAIWETPGGAIKLDEPGARALSTFLAGGLARRDCYFQEEYAIELILPFCLRRFPSVPLFPSRAACSKDCDSALDRGESQNAFHHQFEYAFRLWNRVDPGDGRQP